MSNLSVSACRPCRQQAMSMWSSRTFTTTARRRAIPPESPEFIHIPKSVQPGQILPKRVRGVLPVPRDIFPERQPEKMTAEFVKNATKSKSKPFDEATATEAEKEKHRMAEMRKSHLREGLVELRSRKIRNEKQIAARGQARSDERARIIAQAEREDERLMSSSVLKGMLPTKGQLLSDPEAEKRHRSSIKNVRRREALKAEDRKDALHTLYMNARNFIVTEEALSEEIDRVFPFENDPAFRTTSGMGTDIWNTGVPTTVADMLKKTNAGEGLSGVARRAGDMEASQELGRISSQRIKKIAESLTGGKI